MPKQNHPGYHRRKVTIKKARSSMGVLEFIARSPTVGKYFRDASWKTHNPPDGWAAQSIERACQGAALTDQPRSSNEQPDKNSMNEVSNPAASPLDKDSCASGPKKYKATPACDNSTATKPKSRFLLGSLLALAGISGHLLVLLLSDDSVCLPSGSLRLLNICSQAITIMAIAVILLPDKKS
jgi:hypothetical protein